MEEMLITHLHPERDQSLKAKCFKRKHNFEKFRKEMRDLIQKYFVHINESKDV